MGRGGRARELRGGQRGFAALGIDAGALRPERAGSTHAWLTSDNDKLFLFPTTRVALDETLAGQLVEQAWKEGAAGTTELASRMAQTSFGPVPLLLARLEMASPLHFATARVPLCGDRGAAFFVLQFGAGRDVQAALERHLGTLSPTREPSKALLCCRLAEDARTDFVPRRRPIQPRAMRSISAPLTSVWPHATTTNPAASTTDRRLARRVLAPQFTDSEWIHKSR